MRQRAYTQAEHECSQRGAASLGSHPTIITREGLTHWNAYQRERAPARLDAFLATARWLTEHAISLTNGADTWPIPLPETVAAPGRRVALSAQAQGGALSVLTRAYRVTGDDLFLAVARRGGRALGLDVLDGGVATPVGPDGAFFETEAAYPATYCLRGHLMALLGLYDVIDATGEAALQSLAERGQTALHTLLPGYDTGYWTRADLLHGLLASHEEHAMHSELLQAVARQTGCAHCAALAQQWAAYTQRPFGRARRSVVGRLQRGRAARTQAQQRRANSTANDGHLRVCVPITAFPMSGGMRSVLCGVERVMSAEWQMDYLTRRIGAQTGGRAITSFELPVRPFGPETSTPSQFPNVLFYLWAGRRGLMRLLRQCAYDVLLPQDGVFTAAFTGRVARKRGIPVVTMDHGTATLPFDERYRVERLRQMGQEPFARRALSRARFACYRVVMRALVRTATAHTDRFLVAGDEVAEVYQQRLGVLPNRIIRYPFLVETAPFTSTDEAEGARLRRDLGVPIDALVVLMINRLAPEKGLDLAIEGLARAYAELPPLRRARLRIIIAGAGPLRATLEEQIERSGLGATCTLFGEAQPDDVVRLLKVGDIFLYTGTRGPNSMAALEAMAAACAVIATMAPPSHAQLLADGRGLAIPVGQLAPLVEALTIALTQDERRQAMGMAAQAYVAREHSADAVRRSLRRAVGWTPNLSAFIHPRDLPPSEPPAPDRHTPSLLTGQGNTNA